VPEARGVVSIYVAGRDLERLAVRSGQFFLLRLLTRDGWYRAHPFSISTAPNGHYLRFTVKDLGDWSHRLQSAVIGTRLFLEGPYGTLTGVRRTYRKVLFVAGEVGIAPLGRCRASPPNPASWSSSIGLATSGLVFRGELDTLAVTRGLIVHYLVGRRGGPGVGVDPLGPASLTTLVPDIRERDVYLCGPASMMAAAGPSLRVVGVPTDQVHLERFAH
jgi:predicted ferric reductase